MKKFLILSFLLNLVSFSTFAGGYLTNTNQHVSFLRMPARGASISIDGVYSNPAGLAFLESGLHLAINNQSAYQTRTISADFVRYGMDENYVRDYKGKASAPIIPSVQIAYKAENWVFSGGIAAVGGGGKTSFSEGLPMFDAVIMAGIYSATKGQVTPDKYTINSAMDGKQMIYGFQLGLSYKVNDNIAVYGGGRMNYVKSGYEGFLTARLKNDFVGGAIPTELKNVELDCDQTGWGITPIIGVDFKYRKWNVGLKYEFVTNLNIENKTKKNSDPDDILADYRHGVNTPNDIPAMLMAAVGYEFYPKLRATVEYHQFFDKDAGMAKVRGQSKNKESSLNDNTHEFLFGAEWDVLDRLTLSGGIQFTTYGTTDDFQSDEAFFLDSHSIGLGGVLKLSEKAKLNIGYFWTNYKNYTKHTDNYKETGLPGTDVYKRTNKVFGIGLDYRF